MTNEDAVTVADNLACIIDMAGRLRTRAIDQATAHDIPGGDSLVELGTVGSLADWNRRIELAEATGDYSKGDTEDPDRLWPAIQTLWYWTEPIRETLGHNHDDPRWRPTLLSESQFLRNRDVATWALNNIANYDAYAKDVSRARARLENVLIEGERSERTRVLCGNESCTNPKQLIKKWAKRWPIEWECDACGTSNDNPEPCDYCESDSLREVRWESDPDDDKWKCPTCKHVYTSEQVRDFYGRQLKRASHDRWVQVSHAIQLLKDQGWQERVIRGWIDPDPKKPAPAVEVEKRRDSLSGRHEVLWSSIWRRHLLEQNIREQAAKARRLEQEGLAS